MDTVPGAPQAQWRIPVEPGPAPGYAYGAPGPRLLAWIIDCFIVGALVTAVAVFGGLLTAAGALNDNPATIGGGILFIVLGTFAVTLGYFPWFWARRGATPGMGVFGLRVVRDSDGGPISGGQAIMRLIGYWVSGLVFYLGYIWIFIDERKRGWHDLIAGTLVVHPIDR